MATRQTTGLAAALGLEEKTIAVGGREITLRPLTLGALAALFPLLEELAQTGVDFPSDGAPPDAAGFLRGGADAVRALALAAGLPAEDVGALSFAEAESLLAGVWEINADFFARSARAIGSLDERVHRRMVALLGSMRSSSWSAPDTGSPTPDFIPGDNLPASWPQ
jgi:hypothetical protein